MHKTMRSLFFPLFFVSSTLIVGCGSTVPVVKPFKLEIQQGNVVTSKMLLQLRPGMTKSQVKFIMGTPLIVDSFHSTRWDYFYQLRQAGKVVEQRRVILDFEKDLLARVRGDVVPQGTPGADTGAVTLDKGTDSVNTIPEKKEGLLENLKFWKSKEPKETEPTKSLATEPPKQTAPKADVTNESTSAPTDEAPTAVEAETPSVLAVPITIMPSEEAASESAPTKIDDVKQAPTVQPAESEAVKEPAAVESAPASEIKQIEAPAETAPVAPVPDVPAKEGDEFIFRLDRDLNTQDIESSDAAQESVKKPSQTGEQQDAAEEKPSETEPGYFERMLEKIGF
ncbi:MAG: outer membrane protein assembly factor BamE [Pseudomonadota bacterium]